MTDALAVAERALAAVSAGEAEVAVQSERSGLARFAASAVHQPTLIENTVVHLAVLRDGRTGVAVGNRTSDDGLAELARRAEEAAAAAPADPEAPGPAGAADLPAVEGFDPETAELPPEELAARASAAIDAAAPTEAYGYVTTGVCEVAVASSAGVRAHGSYTDATALVLAAADGASGYATRTAWASRDVDAAAIGREAAEKAARTHGAGSLAPGRYAAVLEPYAFGELLQWFSDDAFSGLALLEERSCLSGRIGERVFDPRLSLADDALDPLGLPRAFDFEGTPKRRVALVEEGVAREVVWDRATAARAGEGRASTGHALPAPARAWGPLPLALSVAPGDTSREELVERVGDGIYVTRVHYLGIVNPREGILTGMTRDGTFRIRDGKLAEPLVNLRFTVAMPEVLGELLGLGGDRQLVNQSDFYDERLPFATLVPAVATASFNVTGAGSGPGL